MVSAPDIIRLAQDFDAPEVQAIALMGSYARGDAGPYSDIDLVRFLIPDVEGIDGRGSHLIDGRLVVVSDVRAVDVEEWFSRPELCLKNVGGLRHALPLIDRDRYLVRLQERSRTFTWDSTMQTRADAWASEQMVGWIEEVHKGLEGLRRDDVGRLLNARFGLSWGLSRIMQVQKGVFLSGDNAFFNAVEDAVGPDTAWARLHRAVFGVEGADNSISTLHGQVVAGLHLYVVTAELLEGTLRPEDAALVEHTVERIRAVLEGEGGL